MNNRTDVKVLSQGQDVSLLKPGIAVSKSDLDIAELTQLIKGNLTQLVGKSDITSGTGTMFANPEIVRKAIELQERYHFEPLGNRTDFSYLTRVISIQDFADHPDLYFTKLTKGFGTFPLDFDLDRIAKNFLKDGGDFTISGGILKFQHQGVVSGYKQKYTPLSYAINKALIDSGCAKMHSEGYVYIDILTFLKNYETFVDIINQEIDDDEIKQNSLNSFASIRTVVLGIFKMVTNITIKTPHEFFVNKKHSFQEIQEAHKNKDFLQDIHNPFQPQNVLEQDIFLNIERFLLSTAKGVSKTDIDELIKIQHPEQFIALVEMLILKIQGDETLEKSWIGKINKSVEEYSTEEMIAFATYLARYLIDDYQKVEDMVEDVLMGFAPTSLKGKCTDYTGMSLHIINSYMKLKYPEKFKNIIVGYDAQNIGDSYKHCYMKVYGYNAAGLIEVTFIDPTKLAGVTMGDLEITDDIMTAMDASNLPIQIDRTAEDIIIAKIRGNSGENIQLPNTGSEVTLSQEEKKVGLLENQTNKLTLGQILKGFADRILSKIRN